jgi:hypothetical protein
VISFPRYYRPCVVVTVAGIQASNFAPLPGPRIAFKIDKTLTSTPDTAEIQIYGLAPATRAGMATAFGELGFAPVTLACGYEGVPGAMFVGDLRKLIAATHAHADVPVIAHADDNGDAIADATLPPTLPSTLGFTAQNMIDAAILAFAQPVVNPTTGAVDSPGTTIVPHPCVAATLATASPAAVTTVYTFVNVGTAKELLDEAARLLKCRWWIRDRQLFMIRNGFPIDGLAVGLPRTHWLTEPSDEGDGLLRLDTFLDPNLLPGRQVAVIGRAIPPRIATKIGAVPGEPEVFRIEAATYLGDTHADTPWRASLTLARLKAGFA